MNPTHLFIEEGGGVQGSGKPINEVCIFFYVLFNFYVKFRFQLFADEYRNSSLLTR